MTLVQFQVYLAVIEEQSFTKAAEKLNMTQSAVSQTIKSLEEELGVTLLLRNRGGVTLTYIGERIRTHVQEVLQLTRCISEESSAAKGIPQGTLRLGSMHGMGSSLLPGLIKAFNRQFPSVKLVLFEGSDREIREWISNAVVDVGFMTLRASEELGCVALIDDPLFAYLPVGHPLNIEPSVTLQQLAKDDFIMPVNAPKNLVTTLFREAGVTPNISYEVREHATVLAMIQEGIGVTILPKLDTPLTLVNVIERPLEPSVTRSVGLGVRSLETVSPVIAEFILFTEGYVRQRNAGA